MTEIEKKKNCECVGIAIVYVYWRVAVMDA